MPCRVYGVVFASSLAMRMEIASFDAFFHCLIRGRTDKKLTSTLVIRTFLSFELADIFLKYWGRLFFKKSKKNSDFQPHCQRRQKSDPLDPERHEYDVSPPERLHFLGLSLHGDISSACKIFPCSICRLREPCAFFLTWWIMTHIPGCHQETFESAPQSRQTHLRRTCSKSPRPVVTNPLNLPNFSNTRM